MGLGVSETNEDGVDGSADTVESHELLLESVYLHSLYYILLQYNGIITVYGKNFTYKM